MSTMKPKIQKPICTNQISVRLPEELYKRLLRAVSGTRKSGSLPTLDVASFTRWAIKEKLDTFEREVAK
jgi:hypothetical protein